MIYILTWWSDSDDLWRRQFTVSRKKVVNLYKELEETGEACSFQLFQMETPKTVKQWMALCNAGDSMPTTHADQLDLPRLKSKLGDDT